MMHSDVTLCVINHPRYFDPLEIGAVMGFPPTLHFPEKITAKQAWRLLGNSLNVQVVAVLMSILLPVDPPA